MHDTILKFWFEEIDEADWWKKDPTFDQLIASRFSDLHRQAKDCELYSWRKTPEGRLAEIILLDQFSRNIFRETPEAFAQDPLAVALAQEAINCGADLALPENKRSFLYMPFMHSESLVIHALAESCFKTLSKQSTLEFELKHKAIIERFGRYPHRNKVLNRCSTDEELEFLQKPGSSF
ncbi:MAG: DUF924 domain-containing protein [Agarilytica sp.]